jgi:hypothetical protein
MALFEVLYKRRCRTLLNCIESREKVTFGPDIVDEAKATVRRIQDNLPLRIRHRHLDGYLLGPEFRQRARSEQPFPLRIPQSLGVTRVYNNVTLVIACLMIDVFACECW